MERDLDGKVAVITGASRGIGAAVAADLAGAGARVVLGARSEDALREVAGGLGQVAVAVPTDAPQLDQLERLAQAAVERFGGVDILVNNAGVSPPARQIYKVTAEEWQATLDLNLRAAWYLSKLCHPHMKARGGGAIVNMASTSGLHHDIGLGVYSISKAALIMLTTVCAKEWARDRIRVNALAPGIVRTELSVPMVAWLEEHGEKPNALNMVGEPEDVARLVRYLVSEDSRYITGDVIRIDGGELL